MAARQSGVPFRRSRHAPDPAPPRPSCRAIPFRPIRFHRRVARRAGLAFAAGIALVATVPAARGFSDLFGWMPLWLVGMPASACLVAYLQRARALASAPEQERASASRHAVLRPPWPVAAAMRAVCRGAPAPPDLWHGGHARGAC
jgi:hypothetical protein